MKKLASKRLTLRRETVGEIGREQLPAVAGGDTQNRNCVPECLTAGNCGCGRPTFEQG